jgi:hypothetical protein
MEHKEIPLLHVNLDLSDGSGQITVLDNSLDSGDDIVGTFSISPNYKPGDIIVLKHSFIDSSSNQEYKLEARILLKSAYVAQATFFDSELLTISETVPGGTCPMASNIRRRRTVV